MGKRIGSLLLTLVLMTTLFTGVWAEETAEEPVTEPQTETTEPQAETTEPQTETIEPQTETTEPQTETTEPQTETAEPRTDATEPEPETTEPDNTETTETDGEEAETLMTDAERDAFWAEVQGYRKTRARATTEDQRIRYQILDTYQDTLYRTRYTSLQGRCGMQVSWQLYLLGITAGLNSLNGNDHYDVYSAQTVTSGGYQVSAYPAARYSMAQALNSLTENGTKDVYNVMVCFQQTNTEAGQKYGHVNLIHAILDGKVYFAEGFSTRYAYEPGTANVVTVEQYVQYWADWTTYEGLVHFTAGEQDAACQCAVYETSLFLQAGEGTSVYETCDGIRIRRELAAGERVYTDAVVENGNGQFLYRIDDDGQICYIDRDRATVILDLTEAGRQDGTGEVPEGWTYENGTWYYRENGLPRSGWICSDGIDYYLREDGSVTTGWAEINGKLRYFSGTGAMRTGWLRTEAGEQYMLRNGVRATGWMDIAGEKRFFDSDGLLCAGGWYCLEGQWYYLDGSGKPAVGWVDMPEGRFSFHPDGYLLAKREGDRVVPYDGTWQPADPQP